MEFIPLKVSHSSHSTHSASSDLPTKSLYHLIHFIDHGKFSNLHKHFLTSVIIEIEPTWFSYTISNSKWQHAMKQESNAFKKNEPKNSPLYPMRKSTW